MRMSQRTAAGGCAEWGDAEASRCSILGEERENSASEETQCIQLELFKTKVPGNEAQKVKHNVPRS